MTLRYGMVGGGPGAFIGPVHRMAAALDGEWRLCAGAFSANEEKARRTGARLGIARDRAYGSWQEMAGAEATLQADERIHAVAIVTPNHLHHPVARAFLERGIHVVCDKPLAVTVEEADDLCRLTASTGLVFAVTYNYSGYPLVKEARARVRGGAIGQVRKVVVEYSQGWLAELLEAEGHKQAEWRADPGRGGPSAVLGDIGSHAHHLMRYVTGLEVQRLFADLGTVVAGRAAHDDAVVLLELDGGIRGVLMASQIATGERNHLRLRIYGSEGGLDWNQEEPNRLRLLRADGSLEVVHRAAGTRASGAAAATRLPGGHPEGFVEAFANLYGEVARAVRARDGVGVDTGGGPGAPDPATRGDKAPEPDFPTVRDGARGIHFIDAAIRSQEAGAWIAAGQAPVIPRFRCAQPGPSRSRPVRSRPQS